MKKRTQAERSTRTPSLGAKRARRILSANVIALLNDHYPISKHKTQRGQFEALGKDAGVAPATVQRAIDPENGISLDVMADLAGAFEIKLIQLLSPDLIPAMRVRHGETGDESEDLQRNGD